MRRHASQQSASSRQQRRALLEDWRRLNSILNPCCDRNRTLAPTNQTTYDFATLMYSQQRRCKQGACYVALARVHALHRCCPLVGTAGAGADEGSNYFPPVARLAQYEFTEGQFFKPLSVVSGTWATRAGTLNSTATTTRAIATIDSYILRSLQSFDRSPEM